MIASTYDHEGTFHRVLQSALPPRSMVGQLTLDQHIGVRIPGGQPNKTQGLPSQAGGSRSSKSGTGTKIGTNRIWIHTSTCMRMPGLDL
jgi:hypothetical protein